MAKVLKELSINGELFSVGDELPDHLVTEHLVKSKAVQVDSSDVNQTEELLVEVSSPVQVETEEQRQRGRRSRK
jgi:predicted anti-sigma-YlaC factor YlaD